MEQQEFLKLVSDMRLAQKKYFKARHANPELKAQLLLKSKTLELLVDAEVDRQLIPKLGL